MADKQTKEHKPCCGSCHYRRVNRSANGSQCQRNAPRNDGEWPRVGDYHWCGLYLWDKYGKEYDAGQHEAQVDELKNLAEERAANAKTLEGQGSTDV